MSGIKIYKYNEKCNACGESIRKERESAGLSQEQLAARLQLNGINLNQKAISRIETGERVIADYELFVFAKVFRVKLDYLFNDNMK